MEELFAPRDIPHERGHPVAALKGFAHDCLSGAAGSAENKHILTVPCHVRCF
jgi:hypothetical protein